MPGGVCFAGQPVDRLVGWVVGVLVVAADRQCGFRTEHNRAGDGDGIRIDRSMMIVICE